jgi:hypothetical protein
VFCVVGGAEPGGASGSQGGRRQDEGTWITFGTTLDLVWNHFGSMCVLWVVGAEPGGAGGSKSLVGGLTPLDPLNPPISSLNLGWSKGGPIFSSTYPPKYFLIFQTLVQPFQYLTQK